VQYNVDYDIRKFADEFKHLKNGESDKSRIVQLAGRVYVKRSAGSKLFFYDIRSEVRGTSPTCQMGH
jgi:lysyl-tRNA synthetase class 2